jgi:fermentation-respiration switch protein FrsA (DUF1100 family)
MLLFLENWFLFHAVRADQHWMAPPAGLQVQDVELTCADGTPIHAWWTAPSGWQPAQGAMVYCHGNAGNLSHRGEALVNWQERMGFAVLIFDYPGYGRSRGKPSEAGCYAAGEAVLDWLVQVQRLGPEDIILYGSSLGGAIAIDLATRWPCRALVIHSAFSSFPDIAQKTFPFMPVRWLVRNQFNNVKKLPHCRAPVLVVHGTADTLVPFRQGERLFDAARQPKRFVPLPGLGHNASLPPEFHDVLRQFLTDTRNAHNGAPGT